MGLKLQSMQEFIDKMKSEGVPSPDAGGAGKGRPPPVEPPPPVAAPPVEPPPPAAAKPAKPTPAAEPAEPTPGAEDAFSLDREISNSVELPSRSEIEQAQKKSSGITLTVLVIAILVAVGTFFAITQMTGQ